MYQDILALKVSWLKSPSAQRFPVDAYASLVRAVQGHEEIDVLSWEQHSLGGPLDEAGIYNQGYFKQYFSGDKISSTKKQKPTCSFPINTMIWCF